MVSAAPRAEHPVVRLPDRPGRASDDNELITGVVEALDVLRGKWNVHLLFFMARGVHRHGELLQCLSGASKKVMTDALRALERDGLVQRPAGVQAPPRAGYSLTPLGWSMTEPLVALAEWGATHGREIDDARTRYHEPARGGGAAERSAR